MIVAFLNRKRIAGILLFILALGSKESALMFPFFYLLISWAYEKRVTRQTITWFIWLAGISIIYIILRITVLSFPAHIIPIQFSERFFSAFKSFLIYIQLLVFPKTLSMDRSFTYLKSPLNLPFIAGFTVFCTGLFLLFRFRNHRRQVLPGYWFMLSFLPISGIFTTLNANVSEHWMYTGCIGIFIYLALLLNKAPRKAFVATVSIVILSYGIRSMVRNFDWADEERFFKKSIEAFPDSPRLHHNLGVVYQHRGEYEKALSELKQAAFLRNKIMPGKDTLTSLMIAETLVKLGRVVEAGPYYNEVLATNPVHPIALADLADIAYADGDVQSAVKLLQICIENNQSYQPAYYKLGRVYLDQKNYQQAKKYLSIAVQMHPEDSLAHNLLGVTLKNTGNTAEAIREFELAVKYNPGETSFMLNLAFLLRENNQLQPAIYWYERAASIQPENPAILNELAVTYAISHNIAHAVTIWERILARYPDFAPAKENLAKALKTQKQL
jgi:tetratricopeptide (TPR) repeat protein